MHLTAFSIQIDHNSDCFRQNHPKSLSQATLHAVIVWVHMCYILKHPLLHRPDVVITMHQPLKIQTADNHSGRLQ